LDHCNEIIVPIFEFRAVRRELEARPIKCFVPRLLPAPLARGVVIESNDEGPAAVVCLEHQLSRHGRPGTTNDHQRVAAALEEAVVAQSVDGRHNRSYAVRRSEISDCEPGGKLISKARTKRGVMSGIPKGGSERFAVLVAMQEHKARVGPMIV